RWAHGFFFSSRRRHTRFSRDWSSDVCSSDLGKGLARATVELCRVAVDKHEGSRHRPLPRLRGVGKDPRVGVVEADGAQKLHETGPVYSGRTQLGRRRASRSERQLLAGPSWNQTSPFGSTLRSLLWRSCRKARRTG